MIKTLVRLIAKLFPMPAKMATLSHSDLDFADLVQLMELTDERQIFFRVRTNISNKALSELIQMQTQFSGKIKSLERQILQLLFLLTSAISTIVLAIMSLLQEPGFNQQRSFSFLITSNSILLFFILGFIYGIYTLYCEIFQAELNLFFLKSELTKRQLTKVINDYEQS